MRARARACKARRVGKGGGDSCLASSCAPVRGLAAVGARSHLREARADLPLELAVGRDDEGGEIGDGAAVDDRLGQLGRMLADVRQRRRRDALQRQLGLLDAEHEQRHGARVHHSLGELSVVARNVAEGPSGGLLDSRVELLQAAHERVERARLHHRLRQLRAVLGDRAQHEGRGLLVEAVLLGEGVDELREDLVGDDGLGQLVVVVRQPPERQRRGLLDRGHVVEEQRAQQLHHAGILERLDVLRARGELRNRLHEVDARLLVAAQCGTRRKPTRAQRGRQTASQRPARNRRDDSAVVCAGIGRAAGGAAAAGVWTRPHEPAGARPRRTFRRRRARPAWSHTTAVALAAHKAQESLERR